MAQSHRGRRARRSPSPTISISAIRNGPRSWASSSAACAASRRPAGRSISPSCPATSRSTTRPTARRSCRRPRSAASDCIDDFTRSATLAFKAAGEAILLVGDTRGALGQSLYLREICGREEGAPPPVDLAAEKRNGDFVRALIARRLATAVHDVSDGGLLVALAEMAMASGIGAQLDAPPRQAWRPHAFWFGEDQARYVVTVPARRVPRCRARAAAVACRSPLGHTGDDALAVPGERPILVKALSGALRKLASRATWREPILTPRASDGRQRRRAAMPMLANDIERLIKARIPDAEVTIRDLAGDGDHYSATVVSETFRGKSRVQQHQIVYDALKAEMGGKLHALACRPACRYRDRARTVRRGRAARAACSLLKPAKSARSRPAVNGGAWTKRAPCVFSGKARFWRRFLSPRPAAVNHGPQPQ